MAIAVGSVLKSSREDAMSNLKAAALLGLSFTLTGVFDANAATTQPVLDGFSITATNSGAFTQTVLSFPKFNGSLGTLTSVDFSLLDSSIVTVPPGPAFASVAIVDGPTIASTTTPAFDFADLSGLMGGLTTADYTGSGIVLVALSLLNLGAQIPLQPPPMVLWNGFLGLTYDYTPAATPLPAALPLFATGLGALGLLGLRRKRKTRASLLGAA
jgi:hypothetical protein